MGFNITLHYLYQIVSLWRLVKDAVVVNSDYPYAWIYLAHTGHVALIP